MRKLIWVLCTILTVVFIVPAAAYGKDPEAYLRINTVASDRGFVETSDADKYYFVEIYMPEKLKKEVFDELLAGRIKLGAIADGTDELPYRIEVSPEDGVDDGAGNLRYARTHFRIYLPKSFDTSKTYEVFFDQYELDSGKALRFRSIPVGSDYSTVLTDKDPACSGSFAVMVNYANENGPFPAGKTPLRFATDQDKASYSRYIKGRITRVHDSLNQVTNFALIDYRVRPLNTIIRPPASLNATEGPPGTFTLPNGKQWTPTVADLPRMNITSVKPAGSAANAVSNHFVVSCILTTNKLPTEDFNVRLTMAALNPPLELQEPLIKTGVSGLSFVAAPGKPAADENVGERSIEKDLDIAISFVSSVEDTKKDNPDPKDCDPITVRERKTRATLDMRLNPFGTRTRISDPQIVGTPQHPRTTATYKAWIPLFIDSKVSTGKITKDTLSLNRIAFGTQLEYRYIYSNALYPQYYRFIGRFSNASDRDFKQAEYKGTFEFRPIFSALNHPLVSKQAAQSQVIFDENNENTTNTVISFDSGGYEFIPFVGGELGRTWARRNPAPAVQPSDAVKRLYGGLDIILTPVARTTLTVSDTFYYNFGKVTKRRANYFIGSIDFLLGKFANSNQASHSIFVSFEKGQQPPFDNSGVNVIKLGYRIQGDHLFSLVGPR